MISGFRGESEVFESVEQSGRAAWVGIECFGRAWVDTDSSVAEVI